MTLSLKQLSARMRQGGDISLQDTAAVALMLSIPSILEQVVVTAMEYIDAAMVGHIGAEATASIGIVSSSTWLLHGILVGLYNAFSIQIAQYLGADRQQDARGVLRQAMLFNLAAGLAAAAFGIGISRFLPGWLGADLSLQANASAYFAIWSAALPFTMAMGMYTAMLRATGDALTPGLISVLVCVLDVVFNFFLIFPTRPVQLIGAEVTIPGMGMGVVGAAIGTVSAELVAASITMYILCFRSKELSLRIDTGRFLPTWGVVKRALHISLPMGLQQTIMCSAYVMTTIIIAPLGTFAIAANSFGVIVESLCYMPGYGIADAATTLVGQSIGAGRHELMKRFAWLSVGLGVTVMAVMGVVMYVGAPVAMAMMTPAEEVRRLGVEVLRIEAFAEPMFAAAIVSYGVFVGAAKTLVPSIMNLVSIWGVRISLAALLAPSMGLRGVWIAMCIELCFRGFIFLVKLKFWNIQTSCNHYGKDQ